MSNLPAYLQNRQAPARDYTAELGANLGTGSPPYISIRNNKFTAIDSTGTEKPIGGFNQQPDQFGVAGLYVDVVITDFNQHTSKVWFEKEFDPNGDWVPPDCWSDNGIGPSRNAAKPQSAKCMDCPKNTWGSAVSKVSGKGIKACHDVQKLAVIIPGDDMEYQLRLPPNSRSNLRDYNIRFNGQVFNITDVVTRVWFDQQTIGTLKFQAVGFMDEATVAHRDKALATKKTDMLVGRNDLPIAALPAPNLPGLNPNQPASLAPGSQAPQQAFPNQPSPGPFAPSASAPSTQTAPPQIQTANPAPGASPSEPPKRGRRRNTAQPSNGPAPVQTQPMQAPFMPLQQQPAPTTATPPNNFGMQQPAPADAGLEQALNDIFGTNK